MQIRALIVDDSPSMQEVLKAVLISENIKIVGQLSNGKGLLQAVAHMMPHIICLDYHLPGSNGLELLKQLTSEYPHIAVIMITGDDDPELQRAAAEAGVAGFIYKPFSPIQVSREIKQILHSQHLLHNVLKTSPPKEEPSANATSSIKALVVDDSKTIRALLCAILAQEGITVAGEATNGLQATQMVVELHPDIVLLDVVMPVMDGMETLRKIRRLVPDSRVIMITANGSRDLVMEALKIGASNFIVKPLVTDKVIQVIRSTLSPDATRKNP